MDVTPEPLAQENIDTAIRFGVKLGDSPLDAKKYLVAFFKKLLLQREKLSKGLLINELNPEVDKMWQEVLSCLEERNRRFVDVGQGSVTFTLFCQTKQALEQLQDETWIETTMQRLKQLLELL